MLFLLLGAAAAPGWNPLTYNLLDSQELSTEKNYNPIKQAMELFLLSGQQMADPTFLNLETGFSGTMMDKIVDQKVRQQALDKARSENAALIAQQRKDKFENCSKLTAGIAFNSGSLNLSDGEVRSRVLAEMQKIKDKEESAQLKRQDGEAALHNKVVAIRQKNKQPEQWDKKDLTTMVSWFKRPGDKALPGNKVQMLRRYYLTCRHDAIPPPAFGDINNVPPPPLHPITADNACLPPNEDLP